MTNKTDAKDMLGRSGLVSVDEARQTLLEKLQQIKLGRQTIPLKEALNRVLAEPVNSPENLPRRTRSVMDGFAVRAADTFGASESMPCYLQITGEVEMGKAPQGEVKKGCCQRIATGGLLPRGADAVVMLEHTVPVDETMVEVVDGVGAGSNLINIGDDIRENEQALPAGYMLRPQDLGLLAGLGINEVTVYPMVKVGILSTGDEIIPHTEKPNVGEVRDINSIVLSGLIRKEGCLYFDYGIVSDKREVFLPVLEKAVKENDVVLFSGGSSVGVRDLGEEVVSALGPPGVLVHGVALKPGKPVLIGLSETTPIFGLPGHPVSAMVCFEFFVKPAIEHLAGKKQYSVVPRPYVLARLDRNINSAPGRLDVVRVKIYDDNNILSAQPIMGKSGAITTLSRANGYFLIDEMSQGVEQDTLVKIYLYQ